MGQDSQPSDLWINTRLEPELDAQTRGTRVRSTLTRTSNFVISDQNKNCESLGPIRLTLFWTDLDKQF